MLGIKKRGKDTPLFLSDKRLDQIVFSTFQTKARKPSVALSNS